MESGYIFKLTMYAVLFLVIVVLGLFFSGNFEDSKVMTYTIFAASAVSSAVMFYFIRKNANKK